MQIRNSLRICNYAFKSLSLGKTWTNKVNISDSKNPFKKYEIVEDRSLMKSYIAMSGINLTTSITNLAILLQDHFTYFDALGFSISTILPALYTFQKSKSFKDSLLATRNSLWLSISILGVTTIVQGLNIKAIAASAFVSALGHAVFYIFNRKTGKHTENLTGIIPALFTHALAVYGIYDYVGDIEELMAFGIWSIMYFPCYMIYLGMMGDQELRIGQKDIVKIQLRTQKFLILALNGGFIIFPFVLPLFWIAALLTYYDLIDRAYDGLGKDKDEKLPERKKMVDNFGFVFNT